MSVRLHNLTLTDRERLYRLGWFTRVRWVMAALALMILLVGWYAMGVRFSRAGRTPSLAPAVNVVLIVFLYNAAFTFLVHIVRARGQPSRRVILELTLGQLACDMIAITALAHFTGGVENYFVVLILVPLVIATELLPQSLAYATAGAAVALIHALAWAELVWGGRGGLWEHSHVYWRGTAVGLYDEPDYVLEVTSALTVTIFATVAVASSISKRLRRREAELEDAYGALRKADEAKSFFMLKAGHEMRAPLAAIHSILGAIAHTTDTLAGPQERLIRRAQRRAEGLMDLVDDLRRYSRLRAPKAVIEFVAVSLEEVVAETVELFRSQAEAGGVELVCRTQAAETDGDEELLREVVTNLVANALQYTPEGGRVEVTLAVAGGVAVLTVADTGVGISQAAQARLFEEFYRAPEAKRILANGTGLGLAITRRIVEMHRGRIELEAQREAGTTFTVRLPLRQAT